MIRGLPWIFALLIAAGCSSNRTFEISALPPDATIKIDGIDRGRGQVEFPVNFLNAADTHTVTAECPGYTPAGVTIDRDYPDTQIDIELKPLQRRVHVTVIPLPGTVRIDGKPVASAPVTEYSQILQFTVGTTYNLTADRPGFATATTRVSYEGPPDYILTLQPGRRPITITTTPPGARILLDDQELGVSPLRTDLSFVYEPSDDRWLPRTITALKPGWLPTTMPGTTLDEQSEYHLDLLARSKTVTITTDPPGGSVIINGAECPRDTAGNSNAKLSFPPIDDQGTLPTITASAAKKTADTEWAPTPLRIGWDDGRTAYSVKMKEIMIHPMEMTVVDFHRDGDGLWQLAPRVFTVLSRKNIDEPSGPQPVQIYRAPDGKTIDSLAISPDGSQLLFTLLVPDRDSFRSLIFTKKPDPSTDVHQVNEGDSLDVMPAYDPGGGEIVYASNRASRGLAIWKRSVSGSGGLTALTANLTEQDFWPSVDADPRQHLFYESLLDGQADSRLYMTAVGSTVRSEFLIAGVTQPRVSPKSDSIAYVTINSKTSHRDIYRLSINSGLPELLISSPDAENYDPAYSHDGNLLAFSSDRGIDEDHRHNPDIWIVRLTDPAHPQQITRNGSIDDCPVWDPGSNNTLYFRSNRGGAWGIWRIDLK